DPRAVDVLMTALADEHLDVRASAIMALGELGDSRAIESIMPLLSSSETTSGVHSGSHVCQIAARALGKFGGAALPSLIDALGTGDEVARTYAADALGYLQNRDAVEALIGALSDPYPAVRWSAAYALGALGDDAAVEPLIKALQDENEGV